MNAKKGKGKSKPNKPPNPNPPQKEEVIDVEKIKDVLEEKIESAQKSEERVPEITSEVASLVVESKDKEEDNPKKPKRNRGKKKKNDKDDEVQEAQPVAIAEEVRLKISEVESQEIVVEENVAPDIRKKKNKNKKGGDDENQAKEKDHKVISVEEKKLGDGDSTVKEDAIAQDAGEQETKTSKKKNKKKKQRNDSEKSESKADEVSCTSAFQMLLKDEKSDIKMDSSEQLSSNITSTDETQVVFQEFQKQEEKDTPPETCGRGKKKNKKDKKNESVKDSDIDILPEISLMTAIKPVLKEEHTKEEKIPQETVITDTRVGEDVKPKAKIAKPVERKHKGKSDKQSEDTDKQFDEISLEKVSFDQDQDDDIIIPEPLTGDVTSIESISEKIEKVVEVIKETSALPVPIAMEENKQSVAKPSEKKNKGKSKKQKEESTSESHVTEKQEQLPPTTTTSPIIENINISESTLTKTDVIKDESSTVPEIVTEKENKDEAKPAERKRKGKKDLKNQDSTSKSPNEDKKEKDKEAAMEPIVEDIIEIADVSEVGAKFSITFMPIFTETKVEDNTQVINQASESKPQKNKNVDSIKSQKQDLKTKEEILPKQDAKNITKIDIIPEKSDLLKDIMPFIPEPIENIQTKQEILSVIETPTEKTETVELRETSFINVPESGMGKKRGKSPKPQKQDQKSKIVESKPEIPADTVDTGKKDELTIKEEHEKEKPKEPEVLIPPPPPMNLPDLPLEYKEKKPVSMMELLTAEILQETEDKTPFELKSKKKRKKSPKLPHETHGVTSEAAVIAEAISKSGNVTSEDSKSEIPVGIKESEEKREMFHDIPSDIEISSLKADESEGSTCGFTPDIIQHPRATSQDLIDDNNNMLIQEITVAEEVKLQIPLDTTNPPLIQGSGTTPLETPENIVIGIQISPKQFDINKNEPEKTDLKSKMMEVNQDMEELRLSIERSLAELTAIEKSEGDIDKKYEDKKTVTDEPKLVESKISMPSEIIAKTQTEKIEPEIGQKNKESFTIETKLPETNILPRTSMFFDKDLPDIELKPDKKNTTTNIPKPLQTFTDIILPPVPPMRKDKSSSKERDNKEPKIETVKEIKQPEATSATETPKPIESIGETATPPVCPSRKDNKNKGKNKKKGKHETAQTVTQSEQATTTDTKDSPKESKKEEKKEHKTESTQGKGKQKSEKFATDAEKPVNQELESNNVVSEFDPIENFEDAMTSSADDINKTFEMIANEAGRSIEASHVNPEIKIVAPVEDTKRDRRDEKVNPVSQPKNLLGHPDIPVRLNKTDYKKEKNKTPNAVVAKVKIKDSVEIEANKQSKDTQTDNIRKFLKSKSADESFSSITNEDEEFVYKYSFRKVFLQSACHVCKKDLKQARVPCNFCNLVFYCNAKHKDDDWPQHQGLCFAISTIVHLKDQKHIYADAKNVTGQDYRLLRMQMIVSCERVLKRKLSPWEQEALLYPRMCADAACREWRQAKLTDCDGCGQISYCTDKPDHLPKTHQRWCKSYALYQKLVCYQQTQGRLEPKLPSKVILEPYQISDKINEALAVLYEEKIDMNDIQYAALTQIATGPLTAAYCHQAFGRTSLANGTFKKSSCTVHIVGGELQFEADALNKWEVFFLHLRPQLQELRVIMVGADLNPSNLPLELLGKVKLCEICRLNKRRVIFSFQDKTTYHDYRASDDFVTPDIVCAFNPSIKRSSIYNGKDPWPKTINSILKQKAPFLITSHSMVELQRDLARVKECSEVDVKVVLEPRVNSFASVRPDRNFISDDEAPLLFKNCCFALVCGVH